MEELEGAGECSDEEEDMSCDYDVTEFCSDPWAKSMNLCTTECAAYLKACEEANRGEGER